MIHLAVFGDIYGYDIIFIGVKSVDGLQGRNNGDFMFDRTTSEKDCYVSFHFVLKLFVDRRAADAEEAY